MAHKFINTDKSLSFGQQDVKLFELLNYGDHRLRLNIRSDAYKSQCHAKFEVFNKAGMTWSVIVYRPAADMKTQEGLAYMPPSKKATEADFKADRDWLLKQFKNLVD